MTDDTQPYAYLNLRGHPRGNLMLAALCANGMTPSLIIEEDSPLATESRRVLLADLAHAAAPLPPDRRIVGNAYDLRFSGTQTHLSRPALLRFHYHRALLDLPAQQAARTAAARCLGLYRWDALAGQWVHVAGSLDETQRILSAPIRAGGTYVLMVSSIAWSHTLYLPLVPN